MKKIIFITIILIVNIDIAQSQEFLKNIPSHDCSWILADNSLFYYCNVEDGIFIVSRNDEKEDSDRVLDTTFRAYLFNGNEMLMVDSLFFTNYSEYAMNVEEIEYYRICKNGEVYFIIGCINGKVFGTFVQPMYIILKKRGSAYFVQSTYMIEDLEDGSVDVPNSVMVNIDDGVLYLTGANLKRIKFYK